jgi:hypothetical protein
MSSLISASIAKIGSLFNRLQVKQFLSIVMVGFMLLATNVDPDLATQSKVDRLDNIIQNENPERPKTTAEWNQQARETKGKPGEKIKRIGKQSADAVKEFGSMYPDVAKNSAAELRNNTKNN